MTKSRVTIQRHEGGSTLTRVGWDSSRGAGGSFTEISDVRTRGGPLAGGYPDPLVDPGNQRNPEESFHRARNARFARPVLDWQAMTQRDHNPAKRRLHLPIVGVTNGTGGDTGVNARGERKPPWLKVRLASGPNVAELQRSDARPDLNTVCEEAMCPNIAECWEDREATFLILGAKCTRRCGFCDVMTAKPDQSTRTSPHGSPKRSARWVCASSCSPASLATILADGGAADLGGDGARGEAG